MQVEQPYRRQGTARYWLILAAIASTATLVRYSVADYSLWFDEQASMFFSQQPTSRLWSSWMLRETNPPLYYTLLKYWLIGFGDSDRAARALSIAAGAASIVATAIFTERTYGRKAAIIAASLTALSAQQCYYSLQVRAYEVVYLTSCAVLVGIVAIDRALREGRAWTASLLLYGLGCTACVYLHTTMVLLPIICTASIAIVRRRELAARPGLLLPLLATDAGIAIAAGWWLDITVRQMMAGAENSAVFDVVTPWFVTSRTIRALSFAETPGAMRTVIDITTTALIIWQAWRSWANPATRLLVTVLAVSVAVFALISIDVPIFLPRTIFWLSLIGTALCAGGIAAIGWRPARWSAILALGLLVALDTTAWLPRRQAEGWTGAITRAASVPGARLIVQGEAMGLLLDSACQRLQHRTCMVPVIAVTAPDDRLDGWAAGLYSGPTIPIGRITTLPPGRYFVFRKAFYHDLLKTLRQSGHAHSIPDDPPLLGPIDRAALID